MEKESVSHQRATGRSSPKGIIGVEEEEKSGPDVLICDLKVTRYNEIVITR